MKYGGILAIITYGVIFLPLIFPFSSWKYSPESFDSIESISITEDGNYIAIGADTGDKGSGAQKYRTGLVLLFKKGTKTPFWEKEAIW